MSFFSAHEIGISLVMSLKKGWSAVWLVTNYYFLVSYVIFSFSSIFFALNLKTALSLIYPHCLLAVFNEILFKSPNYLFD